MNKLVEHSNLYKKVVQISGGDPEDKDKFGDVPDRTELHLEEPSGSTSHTEKKDNTEAKNDNLEDKKDKDKKSEDKKTPILIAAKMGVSEMVETILKKFPVAIYDVDSENKNVALLAVENRQPHVYSLLMDSKKQITRLLRGVDNNGNNALHLAAKCGRHRPWLTPGAALQMQWELKWYTFVKNSMPPRSSVRYNKKGQMPQEVFTTSHKRLRKEGSDWLVKTSESCSVVAALIATVAFATSASVPGGLDDKTGSPVFKDKPAFNAFTISSLLALCLSVTALVFFLTIITSRYEAQDFSISLPRKLLLGLTSLFASIAAVLVSFCTGHIFLLDRHLRYVAYPLYAATCLPVTIFALAQLSLYYDLIRVIFKKVPQRSYREYRH
ncbi:PREDICTED: ankyrin repeat-containing protein At3g12360-like [Prunus mume]|uniref:Ankyrin repeat-containing protein At3g12360-like n=1 Tax=Prunus mume TaxID=102107 RepID=A0ABM1LJ84_PRUMU|nr:PREDICTED: ankyrin repeat-containing protein At3g12360-like [Prunus mume]